MNKIKSYSLTCMSVISLFNEQFYAQLKEASYNIHNEFINVDYNNNKKILKIKDSANIFF